MEIASKDLAFEKAANYRDQIRQLRQLQKQQFIISGKGNINVISTAELDGKIALAILFIRSGQIIGHKDFFPILPKWTIHRKYCLNLFLNII